MGAPRTGAAKWYQLAAGIAVSAACLWWAARKLLANEASREQLRLAFAQASYWTLLPLWACITLFYALKAWRWSLLLKPVGDFHVRRELVPPMMIGFAFNNLLPAHLGDFVRVFVLSRQRQVPVTAVLSSVVLERVFDIIAILLMLVTGLAFVPALDPKVQQTALVFAGLVGVFLVGAVIFVIWSKPMLRITERVVRTVGWFLPAALVSKVMGLLAAAADGLASLRSPQLIFGIAWSSLAQWSLNAATAYIALWSFGVPMTVPLACLVVSVTALSVTVPSSPGYFGVIQLCFMTVLQPFTDDQVAVFGASVYYHLSQYIPVTLIGLAYFNAAGLKLNEVQSAATKPSDTGQP